MRRRLLEQTGEEAVGNERIPYDRTDPMVDEASPPEAAIDETAGLGADLQGPSDMSLAGGSLPLLSTMGEEDSGLGLGGLGTDALSDTDLAGLEGLDVGAEGLLSPEDLQVQQLEAALTSPETSPAERAMIEQQLDLAARRRMLEGMSA